MADIVSPAPGSPSSAEPPPLEAPIVAVSVYPDRARVTRRGRATVAAGASELSITGLPVSLVDDSVRVAGKGAARIVGVDVARRVVAWAPDPRVTGAEARLRDLQRRDRTLSDGAAAEEARAVFLHELARRGGRTVAAALASGEADSSRVAAFANTVQRELEGSQERQRALADQRVDLAREIAAVEGELALLRQQRQTDRRDVVVAVEADAEAEVELEVSYLVTQAGWQPAYDARLEGETVTVTWHGMVTQHTGEDWPAVDLSLSTARPAVSATLPELDPWFVDAWQPVRYAAKAFPAPEMMPPPAPMAAMDMAVTAQARMPAPKMEQLTATAEQGATAVTYRLPRPIAVPSDGSPHKATITAADITAALDYLTVPKLAEEAYLRATVTNSSAHTFLPGPVSVFHGADFVGTTAIETVAPGEEIELQLGVDDRIRVERELTRRSTGKAVIGSTRKVAVTYTITIENHLPGPAKVVVKDQYPVSRHDKIKVVDTDARPEPAEKTDLQELTWNVELAAGAKQAITLSFQLEHPRDLRLSGFTD